MIVIGTALPSAIYTWHSLDQVDTKWLELGRSLRLNRCQTVQHILLPAALPSILTGIRLSTTFGIILLTAAEMLGATSGIGFYIMGAGSLALVENMMAGILVLMLLAGFCNALLNSISRKLLFWLK